MAELNDTSLEKGIYEARPVASDDHEVMAWIRMKSSSISNRFKFKIPVCPIQRREETEDRDVHAAVASFSRTGKIPINVMEASLFKKSYYYNKFLPALLRQ